MFSIIIPTFNNLEYLKLCLNSIEKNSNFLHEIILHINDGSDGTLKYAKESKLKFTHSTDNLGLCSAINLAAKLSTTNYILYAHDDMYFCPKWDDYLIKEINFIKHENFYLSGTMIEPNSGHIKLDCGYDYKNFDETKLLTEFNNTSFFDHQGSHFAPHLVTKKIWNKVGGFSEEFNPGIGSDPDFNMKLWELNIRIFKGINRFRVYHFSSITTRKKKGVVQNKGDITFLKKWGITSKFFKKHYLKSKTKYTGPLSEPKKNLSFLLGLLFCKIKLIYLKLLNK